MTRPGRSTPGVVIAASAGALWGLALVAFPRRVMTTVDASSPPGRPLLVGARLLGARHLAQSLALVLRPDRAARWGSAVDGVHALSMVGLAAVDSTRRRPALVSAAASLALGIASLASRPR